LHIKYLMQVFFSNNKSVDLVLANSPLAEIYQKIYRHLGHVPITFYDWDNPYYIDTMTHEQLVEKLIWFGNRLSLSIDRELCLLQDQTYFNDIHKIYEKNYDGNPAWLEFHEHIHLCESEQLGWKVLHIDYREKAGMLERKFNPDWAKDATTKIKAGDVFVNWAELGKTPYGYWKDNEPNDIPRMCELIKPWLKLRPKIQVALEDIDTLQHIEITEFETWWKQYSPALCKHWNIDSWSTHDIFSVSVFGRVPNYQEIIDHLKQHQKPTRIMA